MKKLLLITTFLYISVSAVTQTFCPTETPALGVNTGTQKFVCDLPGIIEFYITGYESLANEFADYYIDYGDEQSTNSVFYGEEIFYYKDKFTNEQIKEKQGKIVYEYNKSYCEYGKQEWKIEVRAILKCDNSLKQRGSTSLMLQQKGSIAFTPSTQCDYIGCFLNESKDFINRKCEQIKLYEWKFGDNTSLQQFDENPEMHICHKYNCAGVYNVTLYAYASKKLAGSNGNYFYIGESCGSDSLTKPITILPIPQLIKKSDIKVCKGTKIDKVILENLDVCQYDWYNATSGKCEKKDVCGILGEKVAQRFDVKVTGDEIGLSLYGTYTSLTEIPEFITKNESTQEKKATICITPYNKNGCKGTEMCYNIIVYPSAKIIDPQDYKFCNNQKTNIASFRANISGVTFDWKVKDGNWEAIGMTTNSGTGNLPNFTAKNTTKDPITVTIEVRGNSANCDGDFTEFTITVYPLPTFETTFQSPTTCNGTDGWIEFSGLDLNTTPYQVQYNKDNKGITSSTYSATNGTIKVTGLSKGSYTDIAIGAFNSGCLTHTDNITLVDPPTPNAPKISSNTPVCIGTMLELKVDEADSDIQHWKWEGPLCNGTAWSSSLKEPSRGPMEYCMAGTYKLTVERNKCEAFSTTEVAYREDPEVTLNALASVCTGKPFTIDDEVTYNWKSIPTNQQKIKWEIINSENQVIGTQTVAKPTFTINTPGNYNVKVSLEGFGCDGDKLIAQQTLKVKDTNYTLALTADKTEICVNNTVTFTNNTAKDQEITYKWNVTPNSGFTYTNSTNNTSDAPSFLFNQIGNYTITVVSDNECAQRTQSFTVKVQNNPSVTLNIPNACTGNAYKTSDESVKYTWNNVQGVTPTWSATPAEGIAFSNPNSEYPTITYSKEGTYTIRVDMPDAGCGPKNYAEKEIEVYNANYTPDITQDKETICVGEKLNFTNNTVTLEQLNYAWSATPSNGVSISDASASAPSISFSNPGDYSVKVIIKGKCADKEKIFNVRVNKDPEVTIEKIKDICTNSPLELNESLVKYTWYNTTEAEKQATWTVVEGDASSVTFSHANSLYTQVTFAKDGKYKLQVEINQPECGGTKNIATAEVSVMDANFELKVENQDVTICEGADVEITNNTDNNQGVSYTWTVTDADGNETTGWEFAAGNQEKSEPTFRFTHYGNYIVKVIAENICTPRDYQFNVRVNKDPEVTIEKIEDICTNSPLELNESLVKYTWYNTTEAEKQATWTVVEGDASNVTFSHANSLYTQVTFAKDGKYKLQVEINQPECGGTKNIATAEVSVMDANFELKVENQDITICEGEQVDIVNNTDNNQGVSYTWTVTDADGNETTGWEFAAGNQEKSEPTFRFTHYGNYIVKVIAENICTPRDYQFNVRVNKDPEVTIEKIEDICTNSPLELNESLVKYTWYNTKETEKQATWTVVEGDASSVTFSHANSLYTQATFAKDGKYKLQVEINQPECGGTKNIATAEVSVMDANFELKVENQDITICEGAQVDIVNNTDNNQGVSYTWTVTDADGNETTGWEFAAGNQEKSAPVFKFTHYGNYIVKVIAENICTPRDYQFNVRVNKDPEVTIEKIEDICTNSPLELNESLVKYTWYNTKEAEKQATWTVVEGDASSVTFSHANSLYTQVTFAKDGKYKLQVEINQPECGGTKNIATAEVSVMDANFELKVENQDITICEGTDVEITNNTDNNQGVSYTWTVTDADGNETTGWEFAIGDKQEAAPTFKFTHYGNYIVKVIAKNICTPRDYQFNVRVNKDPEVTIEKIKDICTNSPLELNESLVKYTWYNTTEAEKQATWTVVEGDASSVTFSNANSLYTQATFAKDGKYKLQVEINQPKCGGTKNIATAEVSVMDANFELKVENQDITICEGADVEITNNTDNNQGVSYTWTVTDADGNETTGWEFAAGDSDEKAPTFRFTHYGNYIVKVIAKNICTPRDYQFNVRVNKDPEVTFNTFETICNNSTLTIDESKVTYQWYNMLEEEKELEWSIVPNTGVTEQGTTTTKPSYIFTEPGEYTLTVKIKATGCDKTHIEQSVNITVITDNLDLQVTPSAPEGCIPLDITFTNTTSDTDQIKYLWKVDKPQEQWEFKQGSATEKSPVFTFKTEDLYKVTLEAQNKCNTKTLDFNIQTYDKVLFALDALPTVCGEYTFDATSETEGLHVTGNESNIKSVLWVVYKSTDNTNGNYQEAPAESYTFTAGDPTTLRPVIQLKEWGYYKIELQTQTICNDETVSTTIEIEEPIVITLTQPDLLCANIPDEYNQNPYTLIAAPSDGKWTWKEAVPSEQLEYLDADNQLFYPNQPGTYALTYTVQRKACTAQESLEIIVKDYPSLEIGEDIYVCEKDQTPVLLEASPNNGVWTGNEVSVEDNKYYFNPPLTVGSYNLTYTITDAFGCKNRDYKQAHIKPLPKTDFSPEQHCLPDPIIFTPVVDVNTHQFYVNYGDGTEGSDLTHLYDNIGIYDVKLIVSAPNGCVDSLTKSVLVEKFPDQKIIMDKKTGCSPFTPTIELEFDYIDPNTTFTWDFGQYGRQFTEQPTAVTFTAEEEDVTYYFDITVKNICGEYTVRDSVRVLALAKAGVIPSVERGCSPVEVEFKNVSKGSIQRMQYTWDFGDGSEREHGFQASHTFTTTMDKDSTYTVMLIAENACGIDTTYQDIYVIPPVVFPQIIAKNQTGCVGEDICVLNKTMEVTPHHEIITYHWDYGNGAQSDNPTDTCTVFNAPGEYTIKLTITTSCGSSETDEAKVRIYDLPKFNISAVDYICRKDTVFPRIEILSDIREVEWDFGTGDKSNMMQPKYGYAVAGEYTITATATENNFAACKASKNIPLLVRELPNPIITPLEIDSCSPFTYRPIVHDEEINYTIDYENDGFRNANTTHTYVNTSLEPAIYQTKFYLEDKYGCKSNNHGVVTIYPEPIATITIAEVTEARPEVVTFANNSYGANYCKWTLPYRGITETCNDVQEYYYDNILKTTYLEVANEYGCTDKDSIDHQPLMKGLYFPNTFAPNGVTEENRTFNGVGIGLKEYRLEIFDLFGNLIYYTTSLDDKGCPNQGWDGRDQHGNMMPQDVYTWKAEAVFIDGSVYTFGNDYNNIPGTEVNDVNLHRGSVLLLHR